MNFKNNRKAFSMITAIVVILLMSGVGALVMSLSGKIVKETTTQFQREQAILLAKSYTEYAIMAVMANDRIGTSNCLTTINSDNVTRDEDDGGFEVRVRIAYIGSATQVDSCKAATGIKNVFSNAVTTLKSPLNIMVDVYVRYKDFYHHAISASGDMSNVPYITYHKRTLQKI